MRTLEQYLATAKNYLYPENEGIYEEERKRILEFVKLHNLEENFQMQVTTNHAWRTLSEHTQLFYCIDSPQTRKHNATNDEANHYQPEIRLMVWSGGRDPVIKVVMP